MKQKQFNLKVRLDFEFCVYIFRHEYQLSSVLTVIIISDQVTLKIGQRFSSQFYVELQIAGFKTKYPRVKHF